MMKKFKASRYFDVELDHDESKMDKESPKELIANQKEFKVKRKKKAQQQVSNDDSSGEEMTPKTVENKRRKKLRHESSSDEDNVSGKSVKTVKTHDLSEFNPGDFKPSKWRIKKSLKSVSSDKQQQNVRSLRERDDPYPGDAPIPEDKIRKYNRGKKTSTSGFPTKFHSKQMEQKEKKFETATRQAARAELLLTEQEGYIEAEEGDMMSDITQREIVENVDISSAEKYFELKMDKFGPYKMNYTRNGRFLLLGGGKGHIAAIDWQTKKLLCEINVMETCSDIKWLHIETMFAVAQRQWTYVYDNQGIELHCLKGMDNVLRMEFLPYHFLLAAGNAKGYLQWLDVSLGKKVSGFMTGHGRLDVMCQNPRNAILHLGHAGGTVTLWSPNIKEPLVKMLCHGSGTRSIAVTKDGQYMATSGIDRTLKIWDLRTYKMLHGFKVGMGAGQLAFSERGVLAAGMGNIVEMYRDVCQTGEGAAYLSHRLPETVTGLQFCPYEDVLGVSHAQGFSSLLVPGAGEPNFDALEANPFQTKKQRQHAEVKMLLEKVQPDMISLDTSMLGKVDLKTLGRKMEEKNKLLFVRPSKVDFEPRFKKKGRSKAGNIEHRKHAVQEQHTRQHIQQAVHERSQQEKPEGITGPYNTLDRFAKKT